MAYRMIVRDLDGTLTNRDKVITPRTKEALMKLKSQGGTIVLAMLAAFTVLALYTFGKAFYLHFQVGVGHGLVQ